MHPYVTERLLDARTSELLAEAEKQRRASAAVRAGATVQATPRGRRTGSRQRFSWLRLRRSRRSHSHRPKIVGARWHA